MNQMLEVTIIQALAGGIFGLFIALLAVGFTLITLISKSINFVYADICIIGAVISYLLAPIFSNYWVATLFGSVISGLVGLGIGILVTYCQSQRHGGIYIYPLALTYGCFLVFREVEGVLLAGAIYMPDPPISGKINIGIINLLYSAYHVFVAIFALVLLALVWLILTRTKAGALIRAAINDPELLSCTGIRVALIVVLTFIFSSILAGVAGALTSPILGFHEESGLNILLWCLLAVFFGGVGSLVGSFIGGVLLGEVFYLSVLWLDPRLAEVTVFTLATVLLLFRSRGLLGKPTY